MSKMHITYEMSLVMEEAIGDVDVEGDGLEVACEKCPYAELCETEHLWWGCGFWEISMGEDL